MKNNASNLLNISPEEASKIFGKLHIDGKLGLNEALNSRSDVFSGYDWIYYFSIDGIKAHGFCLLADYFQGYKSGYVCNIYYSDTGKIVSPITFIQDKHYDQGSKGYSNGWKQLDVGDKAVLRRIHSKFSDIVYEAQIKKLREKEIQENQAQELVDKKQQELLHSLRSVVSRKRI
jgi:hypothetical protein